MQSSHHSSSAAFHIISLRLAISLSEPLHYFHNSFARYPKLPLKLWNLQSSQTTWHQHIDG
jgi:hypothetical protein